LVKNSWPLAKLFTDKMLRTSIAEAVSRTKVLSTFSKKCDLKNIQSKARISADSIAKIRA
jgi:hypothetical protein